MTFKEKDGKVLISQFFSFSFFENRIFNAIARPNGTTPSSCTHDTMAHAGGTPKAGLTSERNREIELLEEQAAGLRTEFATLSAKLRDATYEREVSLDNCTEVITANTKIIQEQALYNAEIEERMQMMQKYHAAFDRRIDAEFQAKEKELKERQDQLEAEIQVIRPQRTKESVEEEVASAQEALSAAESAYAAILCDSDERVKIDELHWMAKLIRCSELDVKTKKEVVERTTTKFLEMQRDRTEMIELLRSQGRRIAQLLKENRKLSELRTTTYLEYRSLADMNLLSQRTLAHLSRLSCAFQEGTDDCETVVSTFGTVYTQSPTRTPYPPNTVKSRVVNATPSRSGRQLKIGTAANDHSPNTQPVEDVVNSALNSHVPSLSLLTSMLDVHLKNRANMNGNFMQTAQKHNADLAIALVVSNGEGDGLSQPESNAAHDCPRSAAP